MPKPSPSLRRQGLLQLKPYPSFVTFEGTEGSGKSTLMRAVALLLEAQGFCCTQTREPGGTPVAEAIRTLILNSTMAPWTELFLYEAARAEHLAQTIEPALERGEIVLCDRYTDSSLAYQGMARGLRWSQVQTLNRIATQGRLPDLTVFLDLPPAIGLRRASDPNRFEKEGLAFQRSVRQGYLKARAESPERWLTLRPRPEDTPELLAQKVLRALQTRGLPRQQKPTRTKTRD
jgi:dTMP kinase